MVGLFYAKDSLVSRFSHILQTLYIGKPTFSEMSLHNNCVYFFHVITDIKILCDSNIFCRKVATTADLKNSDSRKSMTICCHLTLEPNKNV